MKNDWTVFRYGEWSAEHGMYEEIRELTNVTEEEANDYMLSKDQPMCAYLVGAWGLPAAKIYNEDGIKCHSKNLKTKMN